MALLPLVTAAMPWPIKRRIYAMRGYDVDPTARVGMSVVDVGHLRLGPGARIGHGNVVRRVKRLELEEHASIGRLNYMIGPRLGPAGTASTVEYPSTVMLETRASLLNCNYFDVVGTIVLGPSSVLAGGFTQVWSHSARAFPADQSEVQDWAWEASPGSVKVGAGAHIGARSTLLPGADVPDRCVVAAASVVTKSVAQARPGDLVAGNPARVVRPAEVAPAEPSAPDLLSQ